LAQLEDPTHDPLPLVPRLNPEVKPIGASTTRSNVTQRDNLAV
jgi:hypothetical protein